MEQNCLRVGVVQNCIQIRMKKGLTGEDGEGCGEKEAADEAGG